jgi:hypothetical protein
MRKSRFTEKQIITALKGARGGDAGEGALPAAGVGWRRCTAGSTSTCLLRFRKLLTRNTSVYNPGVDLRGG